jgi:hypothetical protein
VGSKMSKWRKTEHIQEIDGRDCFIWIEKRPPYCDRGNFLAHVALKADGDWLGLGLDEQDGWPRYYMREETAKQEIEDWLKKRGQWVE